MVDQIELMLYSSKTGPKTDMRQTHTRSKLIMTLMDKVSMTVLRSLIFVGSYFEFMVPRSQLQMMDPVVALSPAQNGSRLQFPIHTETHP